MKGHIFDRKEHGEGISKRPSMIPVLVKGKRSSMQSMQSSMRCSFLRPMSLTIEKKPIEDTHFREFQKFQEIRNNQLKLQKGRGRDSRLNRVSFTDEHEIVHSSIRPKCRCSTTQTTLASLGRLDSGISSVKDQDYGSSLTNVSHELNDEGEQEQVDIHGTQISYLKIFLIFSGMILYLCFGGFRLHHSTVFSQQLRKFECSN